MVRCPNCGRKTSGADCQWCKYPILKGRQKEAVIAAREKVKQETEEARQAKEADKQAEKEAKKEAEVAAREKVKREAEEARQAKETDKQAKKQAVVAAREKVKREAEEARQAKVAEKQVKKETVIAAREEVKREGEEAEEQASKEAARMLLSQVYSAQVKHIEECLKELASTREELRVGKIGTEEAIQRLLDISERISK